MSSFRFASSSRRRRFSLPCCVWRGGQDRAWHIWCRAGQPACWESFICWFLD